MVLVLGFSAKSFNVLVVSVNRVNRVASGLD